jgi:PAS domain S-box-containing protein
MNNSKNNYQPLFQVSSRKSEKYLVRYHRLSLTTILILFLTYSFASSTQKDTLVYGSDKYFPPYEYLNDDGEPEGFNIDLISEIARSMDVEIKIKLGDWEEIRKELEIDGTFDISDMFYSAIRDSSVDFSIPYEIKYNHIYVSKTSEPVFKMHGLQNKKVAVQKASAMEDYISHNYPEIQLITADTEYEALKWVSEKKCDAAVVSQTTGNLMARKQWMKNIISYNHLVFPSEYCFVVKEGNTELLKKINTAMAQLIRNGKIDRLREKWFGERIYGIKPIFFIFGLGAILILLIVFFFRNFSLKLKIREAINQLLSSEKRWKFATEGVGDGVWDWNAKTNKVYFSKQWKEMLGYSENEIGNTLDEWDKRVHPDDKVQVYNDLNKHLDGVAQEYKNEYRMLCKDGSYKWILDRGKVIERDMQGKPLRVIGTHTDISERKKTEKELLENRNLLNSIINNSPLYIYITDIEGKTILMNKITAELFNLPIDKIIGKPRESFMPIETAEQYKKNDMLVINSRKGISIEEENIGPEGKRFYRTEKFPLFDENNKIFAVGGISAEITRQKKAEEEIKKLNNELEQRVEERTKEIEAKISEIQRMNKLFVGRELRMKELKEKIKELEISVKEKTKN